ncbi:1-acylglycerol-3-phosphate O [Nadsonia fulvescens var. elongata DSM 6958]|uniref:1-acyl-sn-glycerol-3-phosphate acyltransferase n=1 Tax=Nadsonia fulvescens var. elongata DSM 6958 TaxID=857566 RepID=A0A1E3PRS8_9ASCO|nr:1-acylglycerol-3-phosphate O [Nadsonia fulvescens var. elongata DSM 6958]
MCSLSILKTILLVILAANTLAFFNIAFKPLRFYSRVAVYIFLMMITAIYGFIASAFLALIGKRGLGQWTTARAFYALCSVILGVKIEVRNEEILKTRPAVFLSNHQSELDILILGRSFPQWCSVTAKKSLKYYPFLGWFMTMSSTVFVDRGNRNNAFKAFDSAAKKMNDEKQSVFMFPEGTRSYFQTPDLLPFKKGAFHLAIQAKVPIVPFVTCNYAHVLDLKKKRFEPGTIIIEVLKPVSTENKTSADVNDMVEEVRNSMLTCVKKLGKEAESDKTK